MLNWFLVTETKNKTDENVTNEELNSFPGTPETTETLELISEISQSPEPQELGTFSGYFIRRSEDLLKDIREFDKEDLDEIDEPNKYYFYDLLDEIKDFDKNDLKHIEMKDSSTFLTKLQYTLEVIAVNNRIGAFGIDTGYSYTDQEYKDAYKKLLAIEFRDRYKRILDFSFKLFLFSGIGLLFDSSSFLSGVCFTSILLHNLVLSKIT